MPLRNGFQTEMSQRTTIQPHEHSWIAGHTGNDTRHPGFPTGCRTTLEVPGSTDPDPAPLEKTPGLFTGLQPPLADLPPSLV